MTETPKSETDQTLKTKLQLKEMVGLFLGGIGVFSALLYFLGRLYIESYYYALGITPHVLSFSTNDYMFSSFDLVIMCALVAICLFLYWNWAKPGKQLLFGFPVDEEKRHFDTINIRFLFVGMIFGYWAVLSKEFLLNGNFGFGISGAVGISAGIIMGIGVLLFAWIMRVSSGQGIKSILYLVVLIIFIFSLLPFMTTRLAEIQAKQDKDNKFPVVTVICKDELPIKLLSSSSNSTNIVEGQLIITNNAITYVLQSDNSVLALPVDSIENIKYMKK
jgi:hypothetical protein